MDSMWRMYLDEVEKKIKDIVGETLGGKWEL